MSDPGPANNYTVGAKSVQQHVINNAVNYYHTVLVNVDGSQGNTLKDPSPEPGPII